MIDASDVMTKEIISIPVGTSIKEAANTLIENGVGSIGIEKGGEIVGIVTDRDLVKFIGGGEKAKNVEEIMSSPLITVPPDMDLLEITRTMGKNKIKHLFVKENHKIVGIVSLRDVLTVMPEYILSYVAQRP